MWRAVAPERPHSALQQSSSPLRARKEQGERRHTLHSDGQAVPERRVQGERLERWVTATNGRRLNSSLCVMTRSANRFLNLRSEDAVALLLCTTAVLPLQDQTVHNYATTMDFLCQSSPWDGNMSTLIRQLVKIGSIDDTGESVSPPDQGPRQTSSEQIHSCHLS
eukprot:6200644-Pleurochrysis_carterae.AAC.1